MPRIVVDLERIKYLHCGLGQLSLHFGRALLEQSDETVEPVFLLPPGSESHFAPHRIEALAARPWRKASVQRWLRLLPGSRLIQPTSDLWHVTHQDSKFWPADPRVPVVLTIHDLNFLRTKSQRGIRRRKRRLQDKIDRAAVVTSGSNHAAAEIREHFNLREIPVKVISNGVCVDPSTIPAEPKGVANLRPFLFTLGDIRPSKNFHVLVDMLLHLPGLNLVIAGSTRDPYAGLIVRRAAEQNLRHRVLLTGRVSDGERLWLYQQCEALVFPSLAEGFGLPIVEAMRCGRPVFSSRCTSLPEVGGSLAFYWETFEPQTMAAVVRSGLRTFHNDTGYADRSRGWADQFRWPETARQYLALYREVLSARESDSLFHTSRDVIPDACRRGTSGELATKDAARAAPIPTVAKVAGPWVEVRPT